MLSFEQCFILFCSFPLLFAFVVGGLGFEFCVFVAGWRHALRSEVPFIIIIIAHKSRCEVPMRFTPGWHSGDAGVCLWAVHGATELRVFTVVAFCAAWNGGGVL